MSRTERMTRTDQIRASLEGRWPLTRQERFPRQYCRLFDAVRALAWAVAAGFVHFDTVHATIVSHQGVRNAEPGPGGTLKHALLDELKEAITAAEIARDKAQRGVAKAIGHLIDAGKSPDEIRAAARQANPDALLAPSEISAIVAREQAWWVRLHAQLDQAA